VLSQDLVVVSGWTHCGSARYILGRDRNLYARRTTLVIDAGYSAANALLDLECLAKAEPSTTFLWATRGTNLVRIYGGGNSDQLPARGELGAWLESTMALGPLIDPNEHHCGSVPPHGHRALAHPEPGFYTVGVKSYGRAPTFLLLTGYEQVRSVAAALAGDMVAAGDVRLVLPETGVCTTPFSPEATDAAGCCGGPAPSNVGGLSLGLLTAGVVSPRVGDSIQHRDGRATLRSNK